MHHSPPRPALGLRHSDKLKLAFSSGDANPFRHLSPERRFYVVRPADTEGHTDGIVTEAAPPEFHVTEGPAHVDTSRLNRHRAETEEEAEAAYQRRCANVERLADDAISRRQLVIWLVVFLLSIAASALWPEAWNYRWHP